MGQFIRVCFLSQMRPVKAQTRLYIRTVSPETSLPSQKKKYKLKPQTKLDGPVHDIKVLIFSLKISYINEGSG